MNKDNTAASMSKLLSMTSESKNGHHGDNNSEKKLKLSGCNYIHIDLKGARFQLHFWIGFCRMVRDWGDVKGM